MTNVTDHKVLAACRAEDWTFDLGTPEFKKHRMAEKRRELEAMSDGIVRGKITREMFFKSVGRWPVEDDLERCNCPTPGKIGHAFCGWDEKRNMPNFIPEAP